MEAQAEDSEYGTKGVLDCFSKLHIWLAYSLLIQKLAVLEVFGILLIKTACLIICKWDKLFWNMHIKVAYS
jgi:hypothetical protein